MTRRRRAREESGFAILLVFALAAVLAITLYMELPRSMFERTREREQLLIDRGEQYSLAVRRFYVKFGRFPAKMDDLENTNNMRFLRRQYKDPMTGEADWRIVHEAGGVLSDSLVHPAPKAQGKDSSGQSFGSLTSSMPFGSSMTASSTGAASEEAAPKAPGLLSRPSDRGPLGTSHGGVSTDNDSTQLPAYADNGALPPSGRDPAGRGGPASPDWRQEEPHAA